MIKVVPIHESNYKTFKKDKLLPWDVIIETMTKDNIIYTKIDYED